MNLISIYLRIFSLAGPLYRLVVSYIFMVCLATIFGIISWGLLIPLLEILFQQVQSGEVLDIVEKPTFVPSPAYLKQLFYYHFSFILQSHGKIYALYFICTTMAIVQLLTSTARYITEVIVGHFRTRVVFGLRKALFEQVPHLPMRFFTNQHKGDIIARCISDVQEVERAASTALRAFLKEPITLMGYFFTLCYLSPQLTLGTCFLLLLGSLIISRIIRSLFQYANQGQASIGRLTHLVQETLEGIYTIKAYTVQAYMTQKLEQENTHYAEVSLSMFLRRRIASPITGFIGLCIMILILAYSGKSVLMDTESMSASALMTYIIVFSRSLTPVKLMAVSLGNMQRGRAAGQRIFELLDEPLETLHEADPKPSAKLKKAIYFKDVSFAYDDIPVIKQMNLTIQKGQKIALVGPSGSGKSTIISLINRLYDVTNGAIELDGKPLQDYALQSLRKLTSVVTQHPALFYDTVKNNITLAKSHATHEEIVAAAQIAQAHDFIQDLPEGYQTLLGSQGCKLSTGQAQRISLARAVLADTPILLLDEATSALDANTEYAIQRSLQKFLAAKTVVTVTHRINAVRDYDQIFVMDMGRIVEQGTHQTLMQQQGLYAKLSALQNNS